MAKGSQKTAQSHSQWKGDAATDFSMHERARRWYDLPDKCERCRTAEARDRHHIDGRAANNNPENIAFLCRRCHQAVDGRVEILRANALVAARAQAERTHCKNGHEYTEENTYRYGNKRFCRTCNRESKRRAGK